jgi:hypothetical protein
MTVSFIQGIQNYLGNTQVFQKIGQFGGYTWSHIQKFPTYAQDLRVAYSSLIVANCVAFQVAKLATLLFQCFFPYSEERTAGSQKLIGLASMAIGYGILIGSVTLFVTKAQLPLSPYVSTGISIATVAFCIILENSIK